MFGWGLKAKYSRFRDEIWYFIQNTLLRPRLFDLLSAERVGVVYWQPADMCHTDRLMLYALVRGLRPQRCLEVGVRWGGSARIICNALEENQFGNCVGIDPIPEAFRAKPHHLHGRYTLLKGYSPEAIPAAVAKLDGRLDFVLIDALHTYKAVLADFRGVLPYLAPGAHVLFHDSFHQGIDEAIREALKVQPDLVDCGFLTRNASVGQPVSYQGLRLIRVGKVDSRQIITDAYLRHGSPEPVFKPEYWNFDEYANRLDGDRVR